MRVKIAFCSALMIVGLIVFHYRTHRNAVETIAPIAISRIISHSSPNPVTVAQASLKAVRRQNRIVPMVARYVAVVTSTQTNVGLFHSRKTMIIPGEVRYEVDLTQIKSEDVRWDAHTHTLHVHLPPVQIAGPDVDLNSIQEFSDGILTSFSSIDHELAMRDRQAGLDQLVMQAKDRVNMEMAQIAATHAVEQTFSLPMRAAGVPCNVVIDY